MTTQKLNVLETSETHQGHDHNHKADHCCSASASTAAVDTSTSLSDLSIPQGYEAIALGIDEMDCPVEENLIRKKLGAMEDVHSMQFNLIKRELYVVYKNNLEAVKAAIRSLGMQPIEASSISAPKKATLLATSLFVGAGIFAALAETVSLTNGSFWLSAALGILSLILCGPTTYKKGWIAIKNKNLNINALMSVAVTGAVLLGEFPEAAMVMFLFTLSEMIEAKSLDRARNAIEGLISLAPNETLMEVAGNFVATPIERIPLGATIRVIPGGRFSLDGVITRGASSIDESPITGESMPIDKLPGDMVYAGSINQEGEIIYTTTTTSENSTLVKIAKAISEAQTNKAPVERFIDRFSQVYTPVVFVFAILVALSSPLFGLVITSGIYNALVILIIACPCALVISTPVTIVSGLTAAAHQGILIKGGTYLEQASHLKGLAFDKTGTITEGKPKLVDHFYTGDPAHIASIAYSLTKRSDHPISKAITHYYETQNTPFVESETFEALVGRGTTGVIAGISYYLGNQKLMDEHNIDQSAVQAHIESFEQSGKSLLMLADNQTVLAIFALEDSIKETSKKAIEKLHALGLTLMMLSGDQQKTVDNVAALVNIERALGNQLPQDKLKHITQFSETEGKIGMIGDGINDAPALARADIGFAMGAMGSDTAIETADVAIMDDDLMKLPLFLTIAHKTVTIIKQNIVFALGVKFIFLVLALFGIATMWMAVFADVGTSLLVVLNGLRLLQISKRDLEH